MNMSRSYAFSLSVIFLASSQLAYPNLATVGENIWHLTRRIGDITCTIEDKVCDIEDKVCDIELSVIEELAKVCDIHDCSPIPVSTGGTLSAPGTYCLTQNVTGAFVFGLDDIVLDLNGFELNGVGNAIAVTMSSRSNCELRNGSILGATADCLNIVSSNSVTVRNVDFSTTPTGIAVASTTNLSVVDCTFRDHTSEAICSSNMNGGRIKNCSFTQNLGARVVDLANS